MKKSKKLIIGIILLAIGFISICGGVFIGIFLIAGGVVLILLDKKNKATNETPTLPDASASTPPKTPTVPDGEKDFNLFIEFLDSQFLCYQYEHNIYLIEDAFTHIIGNGGKKITFEFEPENEYDNKAIGIYMEGNKIGYVHKGQTQDMIHSYFKQGRLICGYLNKYSVAEKTATYKIAFYKPMEYFENKQFTLTKTSKKIDEYTSRMENLSYCNEGDVLFIEKDFLEENYIVTTDNYSEIGELPKSAVSFIEENNPKKIYGIFDSLEEDENGKMKAKITVYLIH